jgi:hypothetical protein
VYWGVNNVISIIQTSVLKKPAVRRYLEIPDLPKPVPGAEPLKNPLTAIKEVSEQNNFFSFLFVTWLYSIFFFFF